MIIETTYLFYLVIRVFLVSSFASDERTADSINHLLVVGFGREPVGRAFDTLPVLLLLVAIALTTAAVFGTVTL